VLTLGEVFNLSIANPVIVGIAIAKARYSHGNISRTREYVINLPTADMVEVVDRCGTTSGRDIDKFAEFGLTRLPATKVAPPLIAECPVNIECRVTGIQEIGDHDLFVGEVVAQHVDEELLDEKGELCSDRPWLLCYIFGRYWSMGSMLGSHGFKRPGA